MFRSLAVAVAAALACAAPASAHSADPHYLTRVDRTPSGVTVDVLNRSDQLELRNRSGEDVVIEGYNRDPYARISADGTVAVNTRSPAYYLNQDRYGDVPVPDGVDGTGAPRWKVLDKVGRFAWHDHRMHWMAKSRPPQVKDPDVRTKIFDWTVPVRVGGRPGAIDGTLFWTPRPGAPTALIVALLVVTVVLCAVAAFVRVRRRLASAPASGDAW